MGAGKTTLLNSFRNNSNFSNVAMLDLDEVIEERLGQSVVQLIQSKGIDEFRQIELTTLTSLLDDDSSFKNMVISLGGGSLHQKSLHLLDRDNVASIFLDTPFDLCLHRIQDDPNRPLALRPHDELKQLYESRIPFYRRANLIKSYEEIVNLHELNFNLIWDLGRPRKLTKK